MVKLFADPVDITICECEAAPDGDEVVITIAGEPAYRIIFTDTVPLLL